LAIWRVLLLQNLIFSHFRLKLIPFSEFIWAEMEDRVVDIDVGQDHITREMPLSPGQESILFTTVRVERDLSKKLAEHNVRFSGRLESTFL